MDSLFDLWKNKGVAHVFSTCASYFGIYKNMTFTRAIDEQQAFSMAYGLLESDKNLLVGVCLQEPPSISSWPVRLFLYYPDCPEVSSLEEKDDLENILQQLDASLRPCIVFGEMMDDSLFSSFINLKIPLLTIPETMDVFSGIPDSFFGRIGVEGDLCGNMILQNSDLVLLLGKVCLEDVDPSWFVREGHVIHTGFVSPSLPLHGFLKDSMRLVPYLKRKLVLPEWRKKCCEWRDRWIHLFPPENEYAVKEGIDPYMFFASFHQVWEEKHMMVVRDKWFAPAFQQAVLPPQNRFIPIPVSLDAYTAAKNFLNENQEQPLFLFTDQSNLKQIHLEDLAQNPLPLVIVLLREAKEPSRFDFASIEDLEILHLTDSDFSPDLLSVETLPIILDVELTDDFVPYPKGEIPFEFMYPFYDAARHDMLIPPYLNRNLV